jgi:hypothetical protein
VRALSKKLAHAQTLSYGRKPKQAPKETRF